MKVAILSFLLFSAHFVVRGGVGLTTGQSYVFNFTLPYVGPANGEGSSVNVFFSGGTSGKIWDSSIEFFADSLSGPPFFSWEWGHAALPPNTSVGWAVSWVSGTPPPWPDLQGVVRVTALIGPFNVNSLYVQEVVNGGFYAGYLYAEIPEPATFALAGLGAAALVISRRRR